MKHLKVKFIFIMLTMLFFIGCFNLSKSDRITNYYTLEYPPPEITERNSLPVSILIEQFQVTPMYDSNSIIYRSGDYKRDAYSYHKWRMNPADMVTYLLSRDFQQSSLFKAVYSLDSRFPATHIIKGTVNEFYEKDETDRWEAVLSLSVILIKNDGSHPPNRILFQKNYTIKEICNKKNPQSLAEAMSRAMRNLSGMIIKDVYGNLSK